ncbi:MAG: LysM repeat-containing protein [Hymenobacter sp.]|jgi:hypothetical protein|nr:LysM repeat-containing protein [Hymenobacter sp.]
MPFSVVERVRMTVVAGVARLWRRARPWVACGFAAAQLLDAAPVAAQLPGPRLQKLYETSNPGQDSVFALDSYITLEVMGLGRYMRLEETLLRQRGVPPEQAHARAQRLVLYINDAPLIGMAPESVHSVPPPDAPGPSADSGKAATVDTLSKVIFHLTRRQNTYPYWNVVYNSPWEFAHPGHIGLGYDDRVITNMYPPAGQPLRLKLVRPVALMVALVVVGLLALAIVLLARKSWLLRNTVPNWQAPAGQEPMFSLAKSQLAWWTFLVLGSYLLIYCVTGEMTNITYTTLELLGISAGTAGIGSLIGTPATPTATSPAPPSRGWWLDVLTDDQGVSIHRLQQVGFTLLLGYLFIRTVYKTVALPDWNENEILLLGISSATYLGLKSQENKKAPVAATDTFAMPVGAPGAAPAAVVVGAVPAVPVAAEVVVPVVVPAESVADPVTGAVQFRVEDDMGPDAPTGGPADPDPTVNPNQIPG